ncbi:MAG: enoyl-CoA hydratase-related protein [Thermomicrobium sp.]|nr:enoyl-CoA hydratase-related protein [Thermomicrobium sp.]
MTEGHIRVQRDGQSATVLLENPAVHNALSVTMWSRLAATMRELGPDPTVRVIVLRGAGQRAFSAGADIREFPQQRTGLAAALAYDRLVAGALDAILEAPQPVIAVIQGIAVGGGLELAAACDIRLATSEARFGLPLGRLGVMPGLAEVRTLLRILPPGRIVELVLRGELVDASEAAQLGLVTEVVDPADVERRLQGWIERLCALSAETVRATKAVLRLALGGVTEEDQRYRDLLAEVYESAAYREGVRAFLEKRIPTFGGTPVQEAGAEATRQQYGHAGRA